MGCREANALGVPPEGAVLVERSVKTKNKKLRCGTSSSPQRITKRAHHSILDIKFFTFILFNLNLPPRLPAGNLPIPPGIPHDAQPPLPCQPDGPLRGAHICGFHLMINDVAHGPPPHAIRTAMVPEAEKSPLAFSKIWSELYLWLAEVPVSWPSGEMTPARFRLQPEKTTLAAAV